MKKKNKHEVKLAWCGLCGGITVYFPMCGNNTCNGAYGKVDENGKPLPWNYNGEATPCPMCKNAYKLAEVLEKFSIDNEELCIELFSAQKLEAEVKKLQFSTFNEDENGKLS